MIIPERDVNGLRFSSRFVVELDRRLIGRYMIEGYEDFYFGKQRKNCPYRNGNKRLLWIRGWEVASKEHD